MAPITMGRRKLLTIIKTYIVENMHAVEAKSQFRERASANHHGTLNCSSWLCMSLFEFVRHMLFFREHPPPPGSFLGLPGGSLREGNELREERDGTKEEAHACDPKGSADSMSRNDACGARSPDRLLCSRGGHYPNNASGPQIGLPGRISARL